MSAFDAWSLDEWQGMSELARSGGDGAAGGTTYIKDASLTEDFPSTAHSQTTPEARLRPQVTLTPFNMRFSSILVALAATGTMATTTVSFSANDQHE